MKFNTIQEAEAHYFPYKETDIQGCNYFDSKDYFKMGDWVLIQHLRADIAQSLTTLSKPILALVVGHTWWDMAFVLEYVEEWRAWHYNTEIVDVCSCVATEGKEVKHIQFWTDDIIILGRWDKKPTWKEIRVAYKNIK